MFFGLKSDVRKKINSKLLV